MALQNESGNYLRVAGTNNIDFVQIELFKSAGVRHGRRDEFDHVLLRAEYLPALEQMLSQAANANKSIRDNILTACYLALKEHPDFATWTDC